MSNYTKGNVNEDLPLLTMASGTLKTVVFDETVTETTRISSLVATYALDQMTAPDGPIEFGVAHSDYSDAEILEYIQAQATWDKGNLTQQEISKRMIRKIGVMATGSMSATFASDHVHNNGRPVKTKLNWPLFTGDTLTLWAFSRGAVDTTGAQLRVDGHANLWAK